MPNNMTASESIVNDVLTKLDQQFNLNPNYQITTKFGKDLKYPVFKTALKQSLNQIKTSLGLAIGKHQNLIDSQLYVIFYTEENDETTLRLIFPFGANIANILSAFLITGTKDGEQDVNKIHQRTDTIVDQTIQDLVMAQFLKFYQPSQKNLTEIPKKLIDHIQYKGIQDDSFQLIINFQLPLSELYPPLKKAIKDHQNDDKQSVDYQKFSQAPLKLLDFNPKDPKQMVNLVTAIM